jgi:hypothetical protein
MRRSTGLPVRERAADRVNRDGEDPVLQRTGDPRRIPIQRPVEEERPFLLRGEPFEPAKLLALARPSAIERACVREQIDVEVAPACVAEEMPSIIRFRIRTQHCADADVDIWKATPSTRVPCMQLRCRGGECENDALTSCVEQERGWAAYDFEALLRRRLP